MTLFTPFVLFGEFGAPKRSYELNQRLVTLLLMAKFFDNHRPIALAVHHQVHAIAQVARRVSVAHSALTQEQRVGVLVNLCLERVFQLSQRACNTPRKHWQSINASRRISQPTLDLAKNQSDLIRAQVGKKFKDLVRNPCFAEVQGYFFRGLHAGLQSKKLALQLRDLSSRYRTNTSAHDCHVELITDTRAMNVEAAKHYKSFVVGSGFCLTFDRPFPCSLQLLCRLPCCGNRLTSFGIQMLQSLGGNSLTLSLKFILRQRLSLLQEFVQSLNLLLQARRLKALLRSFLPNCIVRFKGLVQPRHYLSIHGATGRPRSLFNPFLQFGKHAEPEGRNAARWSRCDLGCTSHNYAV